MLLSLIVRLSKERRQRTARYLIVSQKAQSDVALPGYTLRPRRGASAQASDLPFMGALRLSSIGSRAAG